MQKISSITNGPRQSNFELLRIIAMLMVLGLHANFFLLDVPTEMDFTISPVSAWTRSIFEFLCIIAVNVFVLISGWFGIRPTIRGFANFIFQVLFVLGISYLGFILFDKCEVSLKGILSIFCISSENWFIRAYVGLYILSPVLNSFIRSASKRQIEIFLVCFYSFQTIYGFILSESNFAHGYSILSFIGLYVLAHYVRKYVAIRHGLSVYLIASLVNILLFRLTCMYGIPQYYRMLLMSYNNPLNVIGAVGLVMWFSKLKIPTNHTINTIARSSFAVYLFHVSYYGLDRLYRPMLYYLYDQFSGVLCFVSVCGGILIFFTIGILIDQPRILAWKMITSKRHRTIFTQI